MEYRKEIDGLRAFAVIPVIFYHAGIETFSGGFVGVDIFFVISGYLISTIIIDELEQNKFSLVNFYERRARRILPALYLIMFFCIPVSWLFLLPNDMKDFSQSLVAVSFFASNILFLNENGYFDTLSELKPLIHTWSLAVEEQFYLIFPFFIMLSWRAGKHFIFLILALIFTVSLSLSHLNAYDKPEAIFFLLHTRAWEFLIGVFAALYLSKFYQIKFGVILCEFSGLLGFSLILYSFFTYNKSIPYPGVNALVPTIGALMIILFASPQTIVGKFLGNSALVSIGLASYSAYLWHQPLFAFFKLTAFKDTKEFYILLILFTLILARLTFKFVETPFRNNTNLSRKSIFSFAILGSVFFIIFGIFGYRTNGYDFREHMKIYRDLSYDTSKLGFLQCNDYLSQQEPKLNYCMSASQTFNALLIGDSHAEDKFYGIHKEVPSYNWKLIGNSSCPPLIGVKVKSPHATECLQRLQKVFSYIDNKSSSIDIVVLSFAHMYPLDEIYAADHFNQQLNPYDTIIVDLNDPTLGKVDAFYAGLKRTVNFLQSRNIQVIISIDIPELSNLPAECLKNGVGCNFSKNNVLIRQAVMRTKISELASSFGNVLVFDSLNIFCQDLSDNCSFLSSGRSLYRDSHHLSHFGSLMYGKEFSLWLSNNLK